MSYPDKHSWFTLFAPHLVRAFFPCKIFRPLAGYLNFMYDVDVPWLTIMAPPWWGSYNKPHLLYLEYVLTKAVFGNHDTWGGCVLSSSYQKVHSDWHSLFSCTFCHMVREESHLSICHLSCHMAWDISWNISFFFYVLSFNMISLKQTRKNNSLQKTQNNIYYTVGTHNQT
jgi:hypothetical protein